jgi:tetratricopeptide (TPR) repeat protein
LIILDSVTVTQPPLPRPARNPQAAGAFIIFCENNQVGENVGERNLNASDSEGPSDSVSSLDPIDVQNIIDDNILGNLAPVSTEWIARGTEERRVDGPTALAVTDRGVVLLTPGSGEESSLGKHRLAYSDLAAVAVRDRRIEVTTTDGEVWRMSIDESAGGIDQMQRHLHLIGELRSRVVSCRNDVELAAGSIRERARAMDWEQAETAYADTRRALDDLICTVQAIEPIPGHQLAPELTAMGRQLERAHARLHFERAESALALGRHLIDSEEYDRARETLGDAQHHYERAQAHGAEVERGDAFQFGLQRELHEDLDRLGWEIETVAAEPLLQAYEAKVQAESADDPAVALACWEEALSQYGHVLTLESDDRGPTFTSDRGSVRREQEAAAEHIVALRTALAKENWDAGVTRQRRGEYKPALRDCLTAIDHAERARELAGEFELSEVGTVQTERLERMREVVTGIRETAPNTARSDAGPAVPEDDDVDTAGGDWSDRPDSTDDGTAETAPEGGEELSDRLPAVDDLTGLDTHDEISLDLDGSHLVDPAGESNREAETGPGREDDVIDDDVEARSPGDVRPGRADDR